MILNVTYTSKLIWNIKKIVYLYVIQYVSGIKYNDGACKNDFGIVFNNLQAFIARYVCIFAGGKPGRLQK